MRDIIVKVQCGRCKGTGYVEQKQVTQTSGGEVAYVFQYVCHVCYGTGMLPIEKPYDTKLQQLGEL